MMRKFIFVFVVLLFIFPLVSAVNTEIKVKTLADHKVSVFILAPDQIYSLLESFHKTADSLGEVSVTYSGSAAKFDVAIKVSKDNKKIFYERFENYQAGNPINIRIDYEQITGKYDPNQKANVSVEENESAIVDVPEEKANVSVEEGTELSNQSITGGVVANSSSNSFKIFYYIIGILVVLVMVFFVARRFVIGKSVFRNSGFSYSSPFRSAPTTPTGSPNPLTPIQTQDPSLLSAQIKNLQNQLESAQREIRFLQNKEKIKEVEFKIRDEQKELDRLRRREGE